MKVGPEDAATDLFRGLEQMMMVVPINAEINETKHVTQQYWQHWLQRSKVDRVRHFQFQHHNRDDDSEDTVAERFEPACFHLRWLNSQVRRSGSKFFDPYDDRRRRRIPSAFALLFRRIVHCYRHNRKDVRR
jgi:hypothetical protein